MTNFDKQRFEELAAKAESGDLNSEDVEELHEQIKAFNEAAVQFCNDLIKLMGPIMAEMREAMRPMAEFAVEHPEVMHELNEKERESIEEIANNE